MKKRLILIIYFPLLLISSAAWAQTPQEPAHMDGPHTVAVTDPEAADSKWSRYLEDSYRLDRETTIQFYYPEINSGAFPLILFSTGLIAACTEYSLAAQRIASHGFVVMVIEHDSRFIASEEQTRRRAEDIGWIIDEVQSYRAPTPSCTDVTKIAMAGHSYGAATAHHVGGALDMNEVSWRDERVAVVVAFAPGGEGLDGFTGRPAPVPGHFYMESSFNAYMTPTMDLTGTADDSLACMYDEGCRTACWSSMPETEDDRHFKIVVDEAPHGAIADPLRSPVPTDEGQAQAMMAIAFLRYHLKNETEYAWYFLPENGVTYGVDVEQK